MLDLDVYGGTDQLGMFPLFLKRTDDVMAPRLSVVFRRLVRAEKDGLDLWNEVVCFQPPCLLIGKVWVPVMHYCACPIRLQSALHSGQEARIVQIYFSTAFL